MKIQHSETGESILFRADPSVILGTQRRVLSLRRRCNPRNILEAILAKWGYGVRTAENGGEAWKVFQADDPPPLAIVDRLTPGVDGLELCRRVRQGPSGLDHFHYLANGQEAKRRCSHGIGSGNRDSIRKPFDQDEHRARVRVGERMVQRQSARRRWHKTWKALHRG